MSISWKLFLSLMMTSSICFAQVVPDAGILERDTKSPREAQKQIRDISPISPTETEVPSVEQDDLKVLVGAFRFEGNTLFSHEQLERVLAPYLNQQLNFNQINAAVRSITAYYREAGRLVKTSLPKQDVTDGVVTIQIIEASFARARIVDRSATARVDPNYILDVIYASSPVNQLVNIPGMERGILIANDLPGVKVSGALREGDGLAETELQLLLSDEALFIGGVGINNHGSRATGSEKLWVSLDLNSPSKKGDLLSTRFIRTQGSDYIQLNYSLPVALPGLRLGANAAYMDYELISDEFKSLDARGDFKSVGLNASYPLIRSSIKNLNLALDFVHKKYSNEALSTTQSDYSINGLSFSLAGSLRDKIAGGGINSASTSWTMGDVKLGTLEPGEDAGLEGGFNKLTLSASRLQFVSDNTDLLALVSAQLADQHLDSSDRFYLGGINDIRAYPNSEVSGSGGWRISFELRRRLPGNFLLAGFYDMGRVSNKNTLPGYGLKGGGIKVNWQHAQGLKAEAAWSRRIGNNPNPTAIGNDQDGSLKKNRLWLSLSWAF